ncbi:polysaccharide export protein EpsE [Duganella aceris]|uniref:polysaccharide export protein EpsE n=1 Tax=Duganella aceris TaxID=2703883 RepID=UPI0035307930
MKRLLLSLMLTMMALTAGVAAAADVVLGAGDVVRITVYNNPDLTLETRIADGGNISFPLLGQVNVNGLTIPDAERKIAGLLDSRKIVKQPQVNILVSAVQSQQVSVLGQVLRPGRYPIDGKRNVLDMLAQAGGITADGADVVSVIRKRDGQTTKELVDVVEMMRGGDLTRDLELAGNDVLFVERAPRFYIYGEVQRPGPFKLERGMTVLQALSTGGGLTARGTERGIRIKRRDASGKLQVLDAKHDDLVQVDDVVYVKESLF